VVVVQRKKTAVRKSTAPTTNVISLTIACEFLLEYDTSVCQNEASFSRALGGTIPTEIGLLTHATSLHLSNISLSGMIPSELGNLRQLQYLILSQNQLTGSVPSTIGNLY
jgi:Leucine-rich repeat (LRR) protein